MWQVSDSCGAFLNSVDAFLVKKKDIKKQYQTAKKSCKKLSHQKRKECKRIAKATKRLQKGKLEEDLSSAMEARSATMTVQKKSAGVQFVEVRPYSQLHVHCHNTQCVSYRPR